MRRTFGWLALGIVTLCGLPPGVEAKDWFVPGQQPTQQALVSILNAASSGDRIIFEPGAVVQLSSPLTLNKSLTFEGPARLLGVAQGDGGLNAAMLTIAAAAEVNLFALDLVGNYAKGNTSGGAILNLGVLRLDESLISGNSAKSGGGINNLGTLEIRRSLIDQNTARQGDGGGILSGGGSLEIESSTITRNVASRGAGVTISTSGAASLNRINAATVVANAAASISGGILVEGSGAQLWIGGSIVAGNTISTGSGQPKPSDIDTRSGGKISSTGYNIVEKGGESLSPTSPGDQVNVNPLLQPLADNGGRTATYALQPGSRALDKGNPNFQTLFPPVEPGVWPTDQRGRPRVGGAVVDIGAYEDHDDCFEPPVVNLNGPANVTVECGSSYADPGAGALDCLGNSLAVGASYPAGANFDPSTGAVSFSGPGIYLISYTAVDESNGLSTAVQRTVTVVDTTPPALVPAPGLPLVAAFDAFEVCSKVVSLADLEGKLGFTFSAMDSCDPAPTIVFELAEGDPASEFGFPRTFPVGSTTLFVFARDSVGRESARQELTVVIHDRVTPNFVFAGDYPTGLGLGATFDPASGVAAFDPCPAPETSLPFSWTINGIPDGTIDTCRPGAYSIVYTATDAAGNIATATRTVTVTGLFSVEVPPAELALEADPGNCAKVLDLAQLVTVQGLDANCVGSLAWTIEATVNGTTTTIDNFEPGTSHPHAFAVGTTVVSVRASLEGVAAKDTISVTRALVVVVNDTYENCAANLLWTLALDLTGPELAGGKTKSQYLSRPGEARWYKFKVKPGSLVHVVLDGLPADYDLAVFKDIASKFAQLNGAVESDEPELALYGVESAGENYAAENYAGENYAGENYAGENYAGENYAGENYAGENYAGENYAGENYAGENYADANFSGENYAALFPAGENYAGENYAAAQQASLLVFSALPGVLADEVRFNTFSETGEYYVRVRGKNGRYSAIDGDLFTVFVQVTEGACSAVDDLETAPAPEDLPVVASTVRRLFLWDSARIAGDAPALAPKLAALANATGGFVVDLDDINRIRDLNAQADANTGCPVAKNLVAEAVRNVILALRGQAPIEDITLVGGDDDIPFFRVDDQALLASEGNYYPPVRNLSHSQASLRKAQVLTQDRYGSQCQVFLSTGPYDLPGIPVARLVETAEQVGAYIDAYLPLLNSGGILPAPSSLFFSGYDFLSDAAEAVRAEFTAGAPGAVVNDALIADPNTLPASNWTASQFRTAFFDTSPDIAFLAGHFTTGGMLAADYRTRVSAGELLQSPADLLYSLVLNIGCHGGYNTVNGHAIPIVTEQPDWAEAFARKKAVWVSGTGYQYGDTDIVEFGERFYVNFARALRAGSGPVRIGEALVAAKRGYLAETPVMRGIHEKTLLQVVLYGLPMLRIDLPGARYNPPAPGQDISAVSPVSGGPGAERGLKSGGINYVGPPALQTEQIEDIVTGELKDFYFLEGGDGTVVLSGEPVRPLETYNIKVPGAGFVRGVGFRGGRFTDLPGLRPSTGAAATEISGLKFKFATDVFYPIRPWNVNHTGELCSGDAPSRLNVFPGQFLSDFGADGLTAETGTIRRFGRMDFRVYYYSPENDPSPLDLETKYKLALAHAPTVNMLASTLNAEGKPYFSAEVAALQAVGVQEVWVTYLVLKQDGSGEWRSLTLNGPSNPAARGIGAWTGILEDPEADPTIGGSLRYFVQAVSGAGAVSLNTNSGKFFRIGQSTNDQAGSSATQIALVGNVPNSGVYRGSVPLSARVVETSTGMGIDGVPVSFRIGPLLATGVTRNGGYASATIVLSLEPGSYPVQAVFAGNETHAKASVAGPLFTLNKRGTRLEFVSTGIMADSSRIIAQLAAESGPPLKEKTVVFVVTPSDGTPPYAVAEMTDGIGQARLSRMTLSPGTYTIGAYFGQSSVMLPGVAEPVSLEDTFYGESVASLTSTVVAASLHLSGEQAWVGYQDLSASGATSSNRGHASTEIAGDLSSSDLPLGPNSILAKANSKNVDARIRVVLSGTTLADGVVRLRVKSSGEITWRGDTTLANGASVRLHVDWDKVAGNGRFHIWIDTAPGNGPLYGDIPALLETDFILGVGQGEHPAGGSSVIGDAEHPWTSENANTRARTGN